MKPPLQGNSMSVRVGTCGKSGGASSLGLPCWLRDGRGDLRATGVRLARCGVHHSAQGGVQFGELGIEGADGLSSVREITATSHFLEILGCLRHSFCTEGEGRAFKSVRCML